MKNKSKFLLIIGIAAILYAVVSFIISSIVYGIGDFLGCAVKFYMDEPLLVSTAYPFLPCIIIGTVLIILYFVKKNKLNEKDGDNVELTHSENYDESKSNDIANQNTKAKKTGGFLLATKRLNSANYRGEISGGKFGGHKKEPHEKVGVWYYLNVEDGKLIAYNTIKGNDDIEVNASDIKECKPNTLNMSLKKGTWAEVVNYYDLVFADGSEGALCLRVARINNDHIGHEAGYACLAECLGKNL